MPSNRSVTSQSHRHGTGTPTLNRRGSIYIVATSGLVLVAGVGLAAMGILRADRSTHLSIHESSELRRLALSGLELALQRISDEHNWRSTVNQSTGWTWTIAGASITVIPIDPVDANLTNSIFDDVMLTAWATRGDARQGARVRLEMREDGGPILKLGLASTGNMQISDADPLRSTEHIYTRGSFRAQDNSTVDANVFASGTISVSGSSQITGSTRPNLPAADFPDASHAFSTWIARATPINASLLDSSYRLADVTLSPTENPFGTPNPDGIYHIHAARPTVLIENVNISGTLIVTGTSDDIDIRGSVTASPIDPAAPVMMLQGRADLRNATDALSINGFMFVDGDFNASTNLNAAGPVIVLGTVGISSATVNIEPTGAVPASPPEGFSTRVVPAIVEQSWIRAID